jgi:hypothetical protein
MKQVRAIDMTHATPVDGRGQRTEQTRRILDARNALLVQIACRFYPGVTIRQTANRLRSRLLIYRNGRWRRTSSAEQSPHDADSLDDALWCLLRIRDHVPSTMTIRRALGGYS